MPCTTVLPVKMLATLAADGGLGGTQKPPGLGRSLTTQPKRPVGPSLWHWLGPNHGAAVCLRR